MKTRFPMGVLAACAMGCMAGAAERLPRGELMVFQAADGVRPVATPGEWATRRASVLAGMQEVMGRIPGEDRRVPLDVRVEEEQELEKYVRRLISYQSEPGSRTPAYLCLPKSGAGATRKMPAVLCLHPTDSQAGHKVVVGLGGKGGRNYATELAERGYVTLSPAYPHLANYWPNLSELGYVSGTMKAIWDNVRGLDLLTGLEEVDSSRGIGVIGHSLGGHNAIFTAAFDSRITVLATSCGFDAFPDYYDGAEANWYFGRGWCQIRYMPKLSDYRGRLDRIPFDFPELLGVLAPRPVFISAPMGDSNFRWRSVDDCVGAARPVYALLGGEGKLVVDHPVGLHDFEEPERLKAYGVIDSVLRPAGR